MANIAEITIENTVKESRQIMNNNFANLNEGLSTAGSVKTVNNILPDDNGNITVDLGSYATAAATSETNAKTSETNANASYLSTKALFDNTTKHTIVVTYEDNTTETINILGVNS